ncbi:MAG TPA: PmeII family type II restriction endonuclease [Armatimonadota bacterium]|nr:PmeII family type II restriction endonuclease [Armatimonadota bacterium]
MKLGELEALIHRSLDVFYQKRLQKLSELKLRETLRKKNPYLLRAIGVETAQEIVERLLQAFMSSSEETIFGNAFFEPIVKAVCSGVAAGGAGMDVVIETQDAYTIISIKSGPNWGNSSQVAKLQQDFMTANRVFSNRTLKKQFRALLGHCYGRVCSERGGKRIYSTLSGEAFWEEITGDPDFYLKLIRLMRSYPATHKEKYQAEWTTTVNRFTQEFLNSFSKGGKIDWEKLVRFNSGRDA